MIGASATSTSDAASATSTAITISPNKLKAYIQRGDCYVNTGRFQPAIDDFSKVIQMTPANADIFAKRAKAFEKMHKFADAIADYSQAIDLSTSPTKVREMYLARGRVFMSMNSLAQALDDFTVAVELDPRSDVALFERASVFAQLKKYDLALHDLDKVIELESKPGRTVRQESWLGRAHMLLKLADEEEHTYIADESAASTEAGFGANDPLSVFHVDRESALDVQHTSPNQSDAAKSYVFRAIKDVTNALEAEPESVILLEMRGEGYLRVGDFHNALVDLNAAISRDSKNASLLLLRAMVFKCQDAHLSMVPLARAINQVTRVIELSTNAHEAYFARARLHVENHSIELAVEDLSAIVEMYSNALQRKEETKGTAGLSTGTNPLVDGHDGGTAFASSLHFRQQHAAPSPTDIALRALLCRARLYMMWQGSAKAVGVKEAMADYQRILSVAPGNLDAQMELQVAKDVEEKSQADLSAAAFEWLMKHGNGESTSASMKDQHSAEGGKRASKKKKKKGPKQLPPTPDAVQVATEPVPPIVLPPPMVVVDPVPPASQPPPSTSKPPTPPTNRRLLSANGQQQLPPTPMCTRDEACESMSEAEVAPKDQRRAISPTVSTNLVFHFSLTENDEDAAANSPPAVEALAVTSTTPPTVITTRDVATGKPSRATTSPPVIASNGSLDDAASMDDEEAVDFHGERIATTPLSMSSSDILMDERYLKKRKRQLEKLRQDLVDACARRQIDQINDAIVRAARKQMHDQLVDEIHTAKQLLEVLQQAPPPDEGAGDDTVGNDKGGDHIDADNAGAPQATKGSTTAEGTKGLAPASSPKSKSSAPTTPDKVKAKSPIRSLPTTNTSPGVVASRIPTGDGGRDAKETDAHIVMLQSQLEAMQLQYTRCRMDLERIQVQLKPALNYNLTVPFAHKLQGMERCMRPLNQSILGCPAMRQVDAMINQAFGPTLESQRVRAKLLRYLRHVLDQSHCFYPCTPSGSYPLKTYLPDSDIDVCLEVPDAAAAATWHLAVTQALIGAATPDVRSTPASLAPDPASAVGPSSSVVASAPEIFNCTVRNVTFINAEVRVVKCTIDNVSIDFTANRFGALGALSLLHEMDARVGHNHLFKRSLILIKSWAMYDSCRFIVGPGRSNILGAVSGALSTFALNTMVMCIFNLYGKRIVHPLQGLMEFLHMFADFDWQYHAVSLFGAVPIASLNNSSPSKSKDTMLIDEAFVAQLKAKVDQVSSPDVKPPTVLPFQVRACNVVDPLNESNNVARSVTADNLAEMKQAFQGARQALVDIFYEGWQSAEYNSSANDDVHAEDILAHVERVDTLFANGMQMYSSGWRPDLLVHPRQLWHGPAMHLGGGGADDTDVLQTQIPDMFR
ncbi:hypothetical protein DYB32_005788 [Aphanomyces invadans]|uniref:PAP/OAS1 substrate-binding-related domain-containing protein n=1 Tax=Aphanomyces invadans TaxID=157072 RepID=A0A3R6VEQ4_9STRA|nr:hypothetical protein DYB32_005788 [Aphanomyces invadans]